MVHAESKIVQLLFSINEFLTDFTSERLSPAAVIHLGFFLARLKQKQSKACGQSEPHNYV